MARTTTRTLPLLALGAVALISLSGCVLGPPPSARPAPTADPIQSSDPSPSADPVETSEPAAEPADLPDQLEMNASTELPAGTIPGWETSLLSTDGFEPQEDNTFPAGPTLSVVETATGCEFWAYQGTQDDSSTDEVANSTRTLEIITGAAAADLNAEELPLAPSDSQGVATVFLTTYQEQDDGGAEAWFARNFQVSQTTSTIRAFCDGAAGGIKHIDDVLWEHLQINYLLP